MGGEINFSTGVYREFFPKTVILMKTTKSEGGDPLDKYLRLIIIEKQTPAQVFFCEFCKISKGTFIKENLRFTASVFG